MNYYAKEGCGDCKGSGWDHGEPCDCLEIDHTSEYVKVCDGVIDVVPA